MNRNTFPFMVLFLLVFHSCSLEPYSLREEAEIGQAQAGANTILEDGLVFDLGELVGQDENSTMRSDSIYEEIPKLKLIENETGLESGVEPATVKKEQFDYYIVKEHDTAMKIAFYLYKDIRRWREIEKLNGTIKLYTGQKIKVPLVAENLAYNRPEGDPYLVKKGDTIGGISEKLYNGYSRYWINIWENNKKVVDDYNLIFPGFTLYYKDLETVQREYSTIKQKYDITDQRHRVLSSEKLP